MSGGARVYVGRLGRVDPRDIEVEFGRFGRIERVDMKQGFCFVDFRDERDADDAVRDMNGRTVWGERIIVEFSRGSARDKGDGSCFKCGRMGHWARDCREGPSGARDAIRCYECNGVGHIARECRERRERDRYDDRRRSRSRSRSPRRSSRRDSRSPPRRRSRSRTPPPRRSRSRTPPPKRDRSPAPPPKDDEQK